VTGASSSFRVELFLDDVTLASLDDVGFYLYQILMAQPNNESLVFNFNDEMFRFDGFIQVFVIDVIELMNRASLNVSII
jgi:hypothetical protein